MMKNIASRMPGWKYIERFEASLSTENGDKQIRHIGKSYKPSAFVEFGDRHSSTKENLTIDEWKQFAKFMEYEIKYKPAFSAIFVTLEPGEKIVAEAGAMASMDSQVTIKTNNDNFLFTPFKIRKVLNNHGMKAKNRFQFRNRNTFVSVMKKRVMDIPKQKSDITINRMEMCKRPWFFNS